MRARLLLSLVATIGLTAFAPAPFPRPRKASADQMEGWWVATEQPVPKAGAVNKLYVEIGQGKWTFRRETRPGGPLTTAASYFMAVDVKASPATYDLRRTLNDVKPYGMGIFRLSGDEMRIAYSWNGVRPEAMAPAPGRYFMILRRTSPQVVLPATPKKQR